MQTASIFGRNVPLHLLRAIWEEPATLDTDLQELQRLEFLYEHTGIEEPTYVFRHPLTQEVAYASLLMRHRQILHAAVGQALEALYVDRLDEAYDRLAYHYAQTEEAAKAVEYLTRSADKAARALRTQKSSRPCRKRWCTLSASPSRTVIVCSSMSSCDRCIP